ncbi:hypothetical protein N665_7513s0001 [Sinapis alba]|nr:hypothetical protein N665_7513s0001 [Sinapis alba]
MPPALSPAIRSPALPSPPIPPDLLFLQPLTAWESPPPVFLDRPPIPLDTSPVLPRQTLVSPPGAERGGSLHPPFVAPASDLWVEKVKSSFQTLSKVASPSISEDGVPSILAPASISLVPSDLWKDYLVAFFHGTPPSAAKVFADLNPIWGKNGRISVKHHSKFCYLIYIPCVITRKWALDVGFWHSGNCSFTVSAWYPSINLSSMKLVHAPVWVIFRKVPRELWSLVGFSTLASAVGFPVHSEFSDLKPYSNGVIKLRVVIELDKPRPSTARIRDLKGNSVLVSTEFPKLPPRCSGCSEFGHFRMRCPTPLSISSAPARVSEPQFINPGPAASHVGLAGKSNLPSEHSIQSVDASGSGASKLPSPVVPSVGDCLPSLSPPCLGYSPRPLTRSTSLPSSCGLRAAKAPSKAWVEVAQRSKIRSKGSPPRGVSDALVTNTQFAEEEELISTAQRILRDRLASVTATNMESSTSMSRKHARRKIRQQMSLLASSDSDDGSSFSTAVSAHPARLGLASGGQAHSRLAHSKEA